MLVEICKITSPETEQATIALESANGYQLQDVTHQNELVKIFVFRSA